MEHCSVRLCNLAGCWWVVSIFAWLWITVDVDVFLVECASVLVLWVWMWSDRASLCMCVWALWTSVLIHFFPFQFSKYLICSHWWIENKLFFLNDSWFSRTVDAHFNLSTFRNALTTSHVAVSQIQAPIAYMSTKAHCVWATGTARQWLRLTTWMLNLTQCTLQVCVCW